MLDMLNGDVIEEEAQGPWSSPIVLVKASHVFVLISEKLTISLRKMLTHSQELTTHWMLWGKLAGFPHLILLVDIGKLKWTRRTSRRQHLLHHMAYSSFG